MIRMGRNGVLSDTERALLSGVMTSYLRAAIRWALFDLNPVCSYRHGAVDVDLPMNLCGKQRLMQRTLAAGRSLRQRERDIRLRCADRQPLRDMNRVVRKRHGAVDVDLLRSERRKRKRDVFGQQVCLQVPVQQRRQQHDLVHRHEPDLRRMQRIQYVLKLRKRRRGALDVLCPINISSTWTAWKTHTAETAADSSWST